MRKIGFLLLLLSLSFSSLSLPLAASDGLSGAAEEGIDQEDLIYLLSRQMRMDGHVAAVTWANMSDEQKQEFRSHVEDVLILAKAGRLRGLSLNPEVRRELRWDEVNVLAKAYVNRISMNWSLDGPALEAFYKKNVHRYAVPSRILAKIERDGGDPLAWSGPPFSGRAAWYETAGLPDELKSLMVKDFGLGKLPPLKGKDGFFWRIEILKTEGSWTLPLETVKDRVAADLQAELLTRDLARLRERFQAP